MHQFTTPVAILLIAATTFTPQPVLLTGILLAVLLTIALVSHARN